MKYSHHMGPVSALALFSLFSWMAVGAIAEPPPRPAHFSGRITVDSESLPVGLSVTAEVNGTHIESTTIVTSPEGSAYVLNVPGDVPETPEIEGGIEGDVITFKIGSFEANETAIWQSGGFQRLDYDSVGNRLRQVRTTGPLVDGSPAAVETIDYAYDVRGRLLMEPSVASGGVRDLMYAWDANGNQLGKSGTDQDGVSVATPFVWDHEDRLSGVERIDGARAVHRYDADGVWMGQSVSGGSDPGEKSWVVDLSRPLSQVVGELNGAGALTAEFARGAPALGADELLGLLSAGGDELVYHLDALGSVRGLTDSQSAVTQRYAYEAFGEALEVSAVSGNPFRFAGEPYSQASSAYHLRARWLDSGSGRFNSQDPVPSFIGVPQSHHLFTYAAGNPANKVDPTGESFLSLSLGALAIMTVVAVIAIHQLQRPLGGGRRSIVKNIRPVVLEDLEQPWSDAEVNQLLSQGRSLLSREAGVSYNWSRTIERRSNFDSYIDPGIDTEAHADHLIWSLWTEAPQFYPVVFATLLDYKPGASGVTQAIGDWSTLGWRGSIITRYGLQNNERTVVAHELSHGFGFNGHVRIPGRLMTTLGSGERLSANEIMRIRLYSQPWR